MVTERLIASPQLLEEAKNFKTEFLLRTFGVNAQAAVDSELSDLSSIPQGSNIMGVGYGAKLSSGSIVENKVIRVYVRSKMPLSALPTNEQIPSEINGKATDIIPVGDLKALARPVECGSSIGHFQVTAGTLGCLVKKSFGDDEELFILSNNHILANSNDAKVGDDIIEPGPLDGGTIAIAKLTDFEPILLDGKSNLMDAAIAKVNDNNEVKSSILTVGNIKQPIIPPALYQSVRKHGRTTGHTIGVIMDLAADIRVRFGKDLAFFEDQIAIQGLSGNFSAGGDSGSLIVDAVTLRPVSLLFAGGGNTTFAIPIDRVIKRFEIDIL